MDFDETYNINTKFKLFYMKNRALLFACVGILVCNGLIAKEYHVAKSGSDTNPGTVEAPFLTISKAAMVLNAGDTVTVHSGTYREWVSPRNSWLESYFAYRVSCCSGRRCLDQRVGRN